jgi:precorrin-2 C(20)-methyltransferase
MSQFWAVGVGPGDPELLTLKAVTIIRRAQVIYHAGPGERQGRAWEIIRELVRPEQAIRRVLAEPMAVTSAAEDWRVPYGPGVAQIAADCRRGLEVAFVTEGDPTLYSTASYVWQLLAELAPDVAIDIVPGVSSITAAAARARWPLAQKDETLRILPASYHASRLSSLISSDPHLCLLKAAPVLPQLLDVVTEQGPGCEAVYVENLGTEREWITHDLAQAVGRDSYFSLVLMRQLGLWKRALPRRGPEPAACPGKVWVVGIGPGNPELLTRQALRVLHEASDIIGYDGYLKLVEPLGFRATCHPLPLGAEMERAVLALGLARAGRRVAVVSSGDAGIYGMASLVLEAAAQAPDVEVEVVPGVTAATAAAARLGAPLGHDFTCISLSDLLTPWPAIEDRLEAAGQADFVVVLYNPASQQRTWQLLRARDLLLKYRSSETPVGLVHSAYRQGMRTWHTTLGALTVDQVTMETTVIIGSSRTRLVNDRLVTPRGYDVPLGPNPFLPQGEGNKTSSLAPLRRGVGAERRPADLGRRIMEESFALIEHELGPQGLPPWAFAVLRRMIHASADFEFTRTFRYSDDFEAAVRTAFAERVPIVTDTEMVLHGIRTALEGIPAATLVCHLNDPATKTVAEADGLTRSAAGIQLAALRHTRPLLVIGNAPTALEEALRLVEQASWQPAAIIGIPVGFVGVEEAKRHLLEQTRVPYLTCTGRKGGSAVTAAAVNALLELYAPHEAR